MCICAFILCLALGVAGFADAHSVVADPPPSILPTAPVDPSSFVTLQKEDFAAGHAEVHAVFVDAAKPKEGVPPRGATPLAVFPYLGHPPISTIEVQVAIAARPVVLVLGSYRSAHWKLEIPPEANVEKVIAQGYYQQFVSGLPPGTRLLTYFSHSPAGVEGLYFASEPARLYTLFENVRRLTGKRPSTLQAEALQGRVVVDGVATLTQPGSESAFEPERPVVLGLTPMSGSRSETELKSQFCCQREYSTAKATRAFDRGRVYFEATLTLAQDGTAGEQTNIGLASVPPSGSSRLLAPASHLGGSAVALLDRSARAALRSKDVVGVAADLDRARAFVHINGRWFNGVPGGTGRTHSGGVELRRGEEYVAAVSLTPVSLTADPRGGIGQETWELNFGASPFRHAVPDGYTAYATHPGGIEVYTSMRNDRWLRDQVAARQAIARTSRATLGTRRDGRVQDEPLPVSPQAEIHAVGLYEGEPGGVSIRVTRTGAPVVLLLMAYDAVLWKIQTAPGVVIERVVAMGYHDQRLEGVLAGASRVVWSRKNHDPGVFYYYGKRGSRDDFTRQVTALFGRAAASFQGGYRAWQVEVDGVSRDLPSTDRNHPVVIRCGRTTIVCGEGQDRVMCDGREVQCR